MADLTLHPETLPKVSAQAAARYEVLQERLLEAVNLRMTSRDDLHALLGANAVEVMLTNHRNHAAFMANVFRFGSYALLAKTLPWVYRAYHNMGFAYAYFPLELHAWMRVIEEHMPEDCADILAVYAWMLDHHEDIITLSLLPAQESAAPNEEWRPAYARFAAALLSGDVLTCLHLARDSVHNATEMLNFFVNVLQPALYTVGARWENGRISVAQEHLASAIVSRVLASIPVSEFRAAVQRGKAVITASANEFHEIGAWMVAYCLEGDGWEVRYLGANTPRQDLLAFIRAERPDMLCLSVAMPFNLNAVEDIIADVRHNADMAHIKIMLGGQAILHDPSVVHALGADAFAADCAEAITVARTFSPEREK